MSKGLNQFLASPSASGRSLAAPFAEHMSSGSAKGGSGGSAGAGSGQLVSVLMPSRQGNASAGQDRNLTALDRLYVVVLEPGATYATYECQLPRPVLF